MTVHGAVNDSAKGYEVNSGFSSTRGSPDRACAGAVAARCARLRISHLSVSFGVPANR